MRAPQSPPPVPPLKSEADFNERHEQLLAEIRVIETALPVYRDRARLARAVDRFGLSVPGATIEAEALLDELLEELERLTAELEDVEAARAWLTHQQAVNGYRPHTTRLSEIDAEMQDIAADYGAELGRNPHQNSHLLMRSMQTAEAVKNPTVWEGRARLLLTEHAERHRTDYKFIEQLNDPKNAELKRRVERFAALEGERARITHTAIAFEHTLKAIETEHPAFAELRNKDSRKG